MYYRITSTAATILTNLLHTLRAKNINLCILQPQYLQFDAEMVWIFPIDFSREVKIRNKSAMICIVTGYLRIRSKIHNFNKKCLQKCVTVAEHQGVN